MALPVFQLLSLLLFLGPVLFFHCNNSDFPSASKIEESKTTCRDQPSLQANQDNSQ